MSVFEPLTRLHALGVHHERRLGVVEALNPGYFSVKIAVILGDGVEGSGGIEKATAYLIGYLESINFKEYDLRVVRTRAGSSRCIRHLTTPFVIAGLLFHFVLHHCDLAHVNIGPKGSTLRKIGVCMILALLRVPYIVHLHGSGYDTYYRDAPQILKYFVRSMFERAESVVVLGEHWYQFVVSSLGILPKRVRIVYNGVPDHGVMTCRTQGHIIITSIGLVGTRKGTDVLLAALALLPKQVPWKCIIGGNGEVRNYRRISARLGIEDRVEFLGWVDEQQVTALLHRTDIFVLPSRYENQPLTILEAMAAGLPVISTRIGAIPEQVIDGVSGILVDRGDVRALSDALLGLIEDPRRRAEMGQAGRQRYEECFSSKAFAEGIVAVYREVLATIPRQQLLRLL